MTARDALEQATAAQPGERLHRFEMICGPRGGCQQRPLSYRVALTRLLLVAAALVGAGCGSSTSPTPAPAPAVCTFTITIGMFPIAPPTPGQGMVWTTYFAATILPSQATVYLVDVNAAPSGCLTSWTAVSANTSAVQLSPAGGSGRGQVELFMPANLGAQRSTDVTIAGQRATIMQAGR